MKRTFKYLTLILISITLLASCRIKGDMPTDVDEYPIQQENSTTSPSTKLLRYDNQDMALSAHMNMLAYFGWSTLPDDIDKMPDSYGGSYINDKNVLTVCVVSPNEESIALFEEACIDPIEIKEVSYSLKEMYGAMDVLSQFISSGQLELYSYGVDERNNCIPITMPNKESAEAAEVLLADYPCVEIDYVEAVLTLSKYGNEPTDDDVLIIPEYPVYDPSVKGITFIMYNNGSKSLMYGAGDYDIEVQLDGSWYKIPLKPNIAFLAIGYPLEPNTHRYRGAGLSFYNYVFTPGKYRMVQTFDEHVYFSEFELGDSKITADSPYGFVPLDDLPKNYTIEMAKDDGCIIPGNEETYTHMEKFLDKLMQFRTSAMIRVVSESPLGGVIIKDVNYDGYDGSRFDYIQDASRARFNFGKDRTEGIFSFLNYLEHEDEFEILLSNYASVADLNKDYDNKSILTIKNSEVFNSITELSKKLEDWHMTRNGSRYILYSEDGLYDAALTEDPTEFTVGKPGRGQVFNLPSGVAEKITDLKWLPKGRLQLIGTVKGKPNRNIAVFNTELWDYE